MKVPPYSKWQTKAAGENQFVMDRLFHCVVLARRVKEHPGRKYQVIRHSATNTIVELLNEIDAVFAKDGFKAPDTAFVSKTNPPKSKEVPKPEPPKEKQKPVRTEIGRQKQVWKILKEME